MNTSLRPIRLPALIVVAAMACAPALAQTVPAGTGSVTSAALDRAGTTPTRERAPAVSSVSAARLAPAAAAAVVFNAAGSIIVLVDGVVQRARLADITPPADGFAYER